MARARNIKPGFFINEELVELPFADRLLFIGLWTLADREGRLEDRPKRIKIAIFPADDVDVTASLGRLESAGFLQRYEVKGQRCIQIDQFVKHQNPHHMESPSALPPPPGKKNKYNHNPISPKQRARIYERDGHKCTLCGSNEKLQIDHVVLVSQGGDSVDDNLRTLCAQCNNKRSKAPKSETNLADSLLLNADSPNLESRKRKTSANAEGTRSSGIDPAFAPTESDRLKLAEECPSVDLELETKNFIDHYLGNGETGKDWDAKWRKWIRNQHKWNLERRKPVKAEHPPPGDISERDDTSWQADHLRFDVGMVTVPMDCPRDEYERIKALWLERHPDNAEEVAEYERGREFHQRFDEAGSSDARAGVAASRGNGNGPPQTQVPVPR